MSTIADRAHENGGPVYVPLSVRLERLARFAYDTVAYRAGFALPWEKLKTQEQAGWKEMIIALLDDGDWKEDPEPECPECGSPLECPICERVLELR